ncbi:MAG: TetR family transcriptional regulator [Rhodobiaceae bacterium]|mgnify:CR=1 FL=1|nr:TetR family transcriptional regulator [Rhodobiaceae bacterium]
MSKRVSTRTEAVPLIAEVFREHGYEGTSLSLITSATGLGKGSLYNFFPGGKEEMATAVLDHIEAWFAAHIFVPLATAKAPLPALDAMFVSVEEYFLSGRRVCLVGAFALADTRDQFSSAVRTYFLQWLDSLAKALVRAGHRPAQAKTLSEEIVSEIQGAIILTRALEDPAVFRRALKRLKELTLQPA